MSSKDYRVHIQTYPESQSSDDIYLGDYKDFAITHLCNT